MTTTHTRLTIAANVLLAAYLSLTAFAQGSEKSPTTCKDKTGIDWVLPFAAAKARAVAEKRILMVKPIAFGTTADGGW